VVEGQAKLWSRFKGAAVEGKVGAVLPQPSLGCGRADQMLTPYEQGFLVLLALSLDPERSCFHCLLGAKLPRDDREEGLSVAYYDEVRIWGRALSSLHPLPLLAVPDPQMERLAVDTELVGTWTAARSPPSEDRPHCYRGPASPQVVLFTRRIQEPRPQNIGAVAVELTSDDLREIVSAASEITVQGARYPEELERRTGR
jgi:hypothetical protein